MAKGDKKKHQNAIDTQQSIFQPQMDAARGTLDTTQGRFLGNYDTGVGKNFGSYDDIMQGYKDVLDDSRNGRFRRGGFVGGNYTPQEITPGADPFESYGGYRGFSQNGGFSDADIQNIRERAIAPTRAVYQNTVRNINRQRALQGGYSPNATAALAKATRDSSQAAADANIGANASIAQMIQQGKLAGLHGMTGIEGQRYDRDFDIKKFNAGQKNWAEEQAGADRRFGYANYEDPLDQRLKALGGMTSLYGTTPAMAQLFGDQVLKNQSQILDAQRLQGDWGQNQIGNQFENSKIKGNFGQFMDNFNSALGPIASVGGALTGVGNIWNMGKNAATKTKPYLPSGPGYGTYIDPTQFGKQVPIYPGRY